MSPGPAGDPDDGTIGSKTRSPLITLRDVTLQLGDQRILEHVDWTVGAGEHWAIIGRNGSGKSALARALYGAAPVVEGEIIHHFLDSRESRRTGKRWRAPEDAITHVSFDDQKRLLGSQSSYFQSRWNSIQNGDRLAALDLLSHSTRGSRSHPEDSPNEKARSGILRQLGILHLLKRKVVNLSNGEMRKLLLAQALLDSPFLLILDEPFAGLDQRSRNSLKKIISRLMKRIACVVFVTSRPDEIPEGITHALWLENGRIAEAGEASAVLKSMLRRRTPVPQSKSHEAVARRTPRKGRSESRTLFEMHRVSVTYDGVEVLKGIDWSVREGRHWALVGRNGSGKTTLLSLISADNPQAYANDVRVFGRKRGSGESIWEIKKKIGWVSPEMQMHYQRHITVFQAVCSGFFDSVGLYHQCSAAQQRSASAVIRSLGLSELAQTSLDSLSTGRQRMALLARALVKKPKLLILDEPCQGLDSENRRIVLEAVEQIGRRDRTTLIYVTHRLDEIPHCVRYALKLRNGRVLKQGERDQVLGG